MRDLRWTLDGLGDDGSIELVVYELNRLVLRLVGEPLGPVEEAELAIRLAQLAREQNRAIEAGIDPIALQLRMTAATSWVGAFADPASELLTALTPAVARRGASLDEPC